MNAWKSLARVPGLVLLLIAAGTALLSLAAGPTCAQGVPSFQFAIGNPDGRRGVGNGELDTPQSVAVGPDGRIVVADTGNNRIQVFDAAGTFLFAFGSEGAGDGQFEFPYGVAVGPDGRIVVADRFNTRIEVFDATGEFLFAFGSIGIGPGQFADPMAVAVSPSGMVVVADQGVDPIDNTRIQVFDAAGGFLFAFGSFGGGPGQFEYPRGIAVGPNGTIYVADLNSSRIEVFDATGKFLLAFGGPGGNAPGKLAFPWGVAVGPDGTSVVADTGLVNNQNHNRIQVFDPAGKFLYTFGSLGSSPGQFSNPDGVAVGADGTIVVADTNNNRVQVFR